MKPHVVTTASIVTLAVALRLPGLFTDFWLDEVWALRTVATRVDSAADVFTAIHQDINHWLLSLWMFAIGPDQAFWAYRLPSFVAALVAVVAAGQLAAREGSDKRLAMAFMAISAPLVIYSSEARGYSVAAAASVVALLSLVRWRDGRRFVWLLAYWAATSLGLLAHLSFVFALAASTAFLLALLLRNQLTPGQVALAQVVPSALLVLLYLVDLRGFQLSGGQPRTFAELLVQSASLGVGGPAKGGLAWVFGIACVALLALELRRRYRTGRRAWEADTTGLAVWVHLVAAFAFPIAAIAVMRPPYFYPRFLLVSFVFVPLLAASFAHALPRTPRRVVTAAFVAVNLGWLGHFAVTGRGSYDEALSAMLRASSSPVVTVASDFPLNRMVVEFYGARMGGDAQRLRFAEGDAEFWISTNAEARTCAGCELVGAYPASSVSGIDWFVSRRPR